MARFSCRSCLAKGDLSALDGQPRCPRCGSEGVRVSMTMDDYPAGHPFWDELAGRNDGNDEAPPTNGKVTS